MAQGRLCSSSCADSQCGSVVEVINQHDAISIAPQTPRGSTNIEEMITLMNENVLPQLSLINLKLDDFGKNLDNLCTEQIPDRHESRYTVPDEFPEKELTEERPTLHSAPPRDSVLNKDNSRSPYARLKSRVMAKTRTIGALQAAVKRANEAQGPFVAANASMASLPSSSRKSVTIGTKFSSKAHTSESVASPTTEGSKASLDRRSRMSFIATPIAQGLRTSIAQGLRTSVLTSLTSSVPKSDQEFHEGEDRMTHIRQTVMQHAENMATNTAKLRLFLESPYSSTGAYTYASLMTIIVMSSVVISFLQTIDELSDMRGPAFDISQVIFEFLFASETMMRFYFCEDRWYFLSNTYNFIDVFSALPLFFRSYIAFKDGLQAEATVEEKTLLAIVPMIHILKLLRRFEKLQLLVHAFELALEALPVLLYTLVVMAIFFSEILYLVEPRGDSDFTDLPSTLWFTIVTMTTVGYGDKTPSNAGGHFVATILIIISALYMAIPIGIVGHAFSQVWADRDRLLVMHRFRDAFLGGGFTIKSIQEIFNMFDEDDSGELDIEEFSLMLKTMQLHMDDERICMLYQNLDTEGVGRITLESLIDGLVPKAFAHNFFAAQSQLRTTATNLTAKMSLARPTFATPADTIENGMLNSASSNAYQPTRHLAHESSSTPTSDHLPPRFTSEDSARKEKNARGEALSTSEASAKSQHELSPPTSVRRPTVSWSADEIESTYI